ncbi:N-acetylglucosaminidase, alpha [Balamuthia mandrillaris]
MGRAGLCRLGGLSAALLLLFVLVASAAATDGFLLGRPKASPAEQVKAVQGLVSRLLGPQYLPSFQLTVSSSPNLTTDYFQLSSKQIDSKTVIFIEGSSGVSLASGLYHYLKHYCNAIVTWGEDGTGNQLSLPSPLPPVVVDAKKGEGSEEEEEEEGEDQEVVVATVPYRYYMNVCTVSYSSAWWQWDRWEKEIDWMALHGINLPLSFTGQEYIWSLVYTKLGLTEEEVAEYLGGPAFLAWTRMGNVQEWGGPLTSTWQFAQAQLQKKILQRQRQFGMIPVLPGFAGHVPKAIQRIFPKANLTEGYWNSFTSPYNPTYLLDPLDPAFLQIGSTFIKLQTSYFGTDHIYNADTFNEMTPVSSDASYLAATSKAVLQGMKVADPSAKWLMQGWLFLSGWWNPDRIKAYLGSISNDEMVILDLYSETTPIWSQTNSYFGKPFIWCMLHNFGGNRALYGNLSSIATLPLEALHTPGSTMVGMGMTPEAIEQNPVMYELLTDMAWLSSAPNVSQWLIDYARQRYGSSSPSAEQSWMLLHQSVYQQPKIDKSKVELLPDFSVPWNANSNPLSDTTMLTSAWYNLLKSKNEFVGGKVTGPWTYDLVDVSRQVLVNLFYDANRLMSVVYKDYINKNQQLPKPTLRMESIGNAMLQMISDLDRLLATDSNYLLGKWVNRAQKWATTSEEAHQLDFNAKNQITLWGPNGEINDYASKQWSGLLSAYYSRRWSLLLFEVVWAMEFGQPFDPSSYHQKALALGQLWATYSFNQTFPSKPSGEDSYKVANELYANYSSEALLSKFYTKQEGRDAPGNDMFANVPAWTKDLGQLAFLCNLDPACAGFNTNGWLKYSVSPTVPSSVDLWVKKAARKN